MGNRERKFDGKAGRIIRTVVFIILVFALLCNYTYIFRSKNEADCYPDGDPTGA